MPNINEKLQQFLEDRMNEISKNVYETYNQTINDLINTDEIVPVFSNAIEELLAANYKGDVFEILETVFSKNQESFCNTHVESFLEALKELIQRNRQAN